jgi:Ca-activated chloride channel homolog
MRTHLASLNFLRVHSHSLYFSGLRPTHPTKKNTKKQVTPLVFDLELRVEGSGGAEGWTMVKSYQEGSPPEEAGTVLRVPTLFPSPETEEGVRGGVILLRVRPPEGGPAAAPLVLAMSYVGRSGQAEASRRAVSLPDQILLGRGAGSGFYESKGVRKAVLLARYTDLLKNWWVPFFH